MTLLADLGNSEAKRSKSAKKLAEYVVQSPQTVISMSIANLATQVGVSQPTVGRFCTGLGLKGFPDFKLTLAGELARQQPGIARNIGANDSSSHVIAKIFESTQASLNRVQKDLDDKVVEAAVDILDGARSIVLCGLGASASVALDAQHKLLRFGTPVVAHSDLINQRLAAASLSPEDCLVCISYTGRTIAMVEIAELGRASGARTIGITAPHSPLAANCDIVLPVASEEDTELYTPMTSRIAQLVLVDVLATRLAIKKGPNFLNHLASVKSSLAKTRHDR
ncbi:MAG: RpiR family carbohydrate utilization transcriptional regulator [Halieaceae bacterium]